MGERHNKKRIYNARLKRILPFVTFKHDRRHNLDTYLTPSQKAEITRYYNYLKKITRKPYSYYRPRYYNKNRPDIEAALKTTNNPHKKLKIVPVDTKGNHVEEIKIVKHKKKGKIIRELKVIQKVEGKKREYLYNDFDTGELARKPGTYLKNLLDKYPDNYKFIIKCGKYRHHQITPKEDFIKNVIDFMNKYDNWEKWMTGFILVKPKK